MSQDRTREPGRWEPSPAHATSQCLVGWASAARPKRDVVWLQICTHRLPLLLSVHAPRACVLASPEPGSGETSDFCVSREPGSRYLFASRETGPIAGAANQSAGACIGRAWFGAHAANQTHPSSFGNLAKKNGSATSPMQDSARVCSEIRGVFRCQKPLII